MSRRKAQLFTPSGERRLTADQEVGVRLTHGGHTEDMSARRLLNAIALVAVVVASTACSSGGGQLETAQDWLTAYEAGDVATYQSLMSPETSYDCLNCGYDRATAEYFGPVGGADQDVRDSRLLALGQGSLNPSCVADGDLVACTTERISAFGYVGADGQPSQIDRSTYDFTFDDGQITHLTVTRMGGNLFDFNKIQNYRLWVQEQHPEDYDNLFLLSTILVDDDSIFALHQELASEYLNPP